MKCSFCEQEDFENVKNKENEVRCKTCNKVYKLENGNLIDTGKQMNSNGVEGIEVKRGLFVPSCCLNCCNYDWEPTQDGLGETFYYCIRNIKFPTKKGSCKFQNKEIKQYKVTENMF